MKTKNILTLLSVLIIFFCIYPLFELINYIDLIIDEYNGYIVLFVLFYSIILSMLTLILVRLDFGKLLFFQIMLSMTIFGLNIGILIYFIIIIRDFWISMLIGLTALRLASIVSIICSISIIIFSYFQIKSKKHMKFSIEDLKSKIKLFYYNACKPYKSRKVMQI